MLILAILVIVWKRDGLLTIFAFMNRSVVQSHEELM